MTPITWHILTGEYPPTPGGVSDYTFQVAHALAVQGDRVHVWTRGHRQPDCNDAVIVHGLACGFSPIAFEQISRAIDRSPRHTRMLVQYVPHAFGYKAMNLPFAIWLATRGREIAIDVMFHEVAYPIERSDAVRRQMLGGVNRVMAALVARRADRIFVSTPAWQPLLRRMLSRDRQIDWLPVPANVPTDADADRVATIRSDLAPEDGPLVGHFGTYGSAIADVLRAVIITTLNRRSQLRFVLLGRGSRQFAESIACEMPQFARNIIAIGGQASDEISARIKACDVMLQPYPDGASARRSTMMAGLALGAAIVSNRGHLCDVDQWEIPEAVALAANPSPAALSAELARVVDDVDARRAMSIQATRQYNEHFSLMQTISRLRNNEKAN